MIKAAIFDMDGVLVDTKNFHFMAMRSLFKQEYKLDITEKYYFDKEMFGRMDVDLIAELLKKYRLKGDIEELRLKKKKILEKLEKGHLKLFPGTKNTLRKLSEKYKIALVSSEWKNIVISLFRRFGILHYFDVIIGKEDVKKHKPDPQPYLAAAKKLRLKPSECAVVEDSVVGVESGKRAGMKVIAVMTSYPKEKLRKADLIVNTVADIEI
jgi:HAD superfamily hydrolase (TIGR01509 family)